MDFSSIADTIQWSGIGARPLLLLWLCMVMEARTFAASDLNMKPNETMRYVEENVFWIFSGELAFDLAGYIDG